MKHKRWTALAVGATTLYGVSIPFNKILLGHVGPFYLIVFSNLGAIAVLLAYLLIRHRRDPLPRPLFDRSSLPWLAGSLLFGGFFGPVFGLIGIDKTSATVSSLLFNFEVLFTVFIAALLFKEKISDLAYFAAIAVFAGGAFTTWESGRLEVTLIGVLLILLSAFSFGFDSNFLKQVKNMDPVFIIFVAMIASLFASLLGALIMEDTLPAVPIMLWSMLLGAVCYAGANVVYYLCLTKIGAARTSTFFGTSPFIGAVASVLILNEPWVWQFWPGMGLMALGVGFLLYEDVMEGDKSIFW